MSDFVSLLETSKEVHGLLFKYILWVAFLTSYHVRLMEYLPTSQVWVYYLPGLLTSTTYFVLQKALLKVRKCSSTFRKLKFAAFDFFPVDLLKL